MRPRLQRLARQRENRIFGLLLLTLAVVGAINPAFLSGGNLRDMLVQSVPAIVVACGLTFVVILGEIDISVGSLMGALAMLLGLLASPSHAGWPVGAAIALVLIAGAGVGLLNGLLVAYGQMPSIIVTLGMKTVLAGLTLVLMNGQWIVDLPRGLRFFGIGTFLRVPISLWTALVVVVLTALLARQTPLGQRLYAAGSNPDAARLAGLSTTKLKLFAFGLTGFLTAVATVVSVPHLSVIESGIGQGFELLVVTCVVVGGTSISGGRGAVLGSVLAALLLGLVRPMLIFLHLGPSADHWEKAIAGAFILVAVLADHLARQRPRREARA